MADLLQMQRFAAQAKSLTEDPAFRRAFEKLYLEAFEIIRRSDPAEVEAREGAYWSLRTLERLDSALQSEIKAYDRASVQQDRQQ